MDGVFMLSKNVTIFPTHKKNNLSTVARARLPAPIISWDFQREVFAHVNLRSVAWGGIW